MVRNSAFACTGKKSAIKMPFTMACVAQGWVAGWAVTTFASAALFTFQSGQVQSYSNVLRSVFEVADQVPPEGKLTYGFSLALAVLATRTVARTHATLLFGVLVASVASMASALWIVPVNYYPNITDFGALWVTLHLLAASIGGGALFFTAWICARRKETKS